MADTPPVPHTHLDKKMGPMSRKQWIGVIAVGVVGGLWWRSHGTSSAAASSATPASQPTDPNIDPATGIPWSQEAAQQSAGLSGGGGGIGTSATDPTIDPNTGQPWSTEQTPPENLPSTTITIQAPDSPVSGKPFPANPKHGHYVHTKDGPKLIGFVEGKWRPVGPGTGITWKNGAWSKNGKPLTRHSNPPAKPHSETHHSTPTRRRSPVAKHGGHKK